VVFQALYQRVMQSLAYIFGKRRRLGVTINLNRLARRVYNDSTVVTIGEMLLQFNANSSAQIAIQIFRQLGN
jgi:hypothetical protein